MPRRRPPPRRSRRHRPQKPRLRSNNMRQLQRWTMVAALLVFAACSKDKDIDKPAQLTPFSATLKVERVWSASVGDKKAKPLRLGLGLAVEGDRVYAAGHGGDVVAYDL